MKEIRIKGAAANNQPLVDWIQTLVYLCKPDEVHVCDGSQEEYDKLCNQMVETGTFIRLNDKKRPNSFLCRSDPKDVARVEEAERSRPLSGSEEKN